MVSYGGYGLDAKRPILCISDTQIPYEHPKALKFCSYLKKHYKIPDQNIIHVGDELDVFHGSAFDKDPDAPHSATDEIEISKERIKQWGAEFPLMRLAISNHGMRWVRKATAAQIPSQVLKSYKDLFNMPEGWEWREEWRFIQLKHPFRVVHGLGYSGKDGARNAAIDAQISTVIGHLHGHPGINYIKMLGGSRIYGFNTGCLIDGESFAFKYGKYSRVQPGIGCGIIFNEGSMPVWVPLD